jgi:diguanylate cyclase (GGDEF)-like protein
VSSSLSRVAGAPPGAEVFCFFFSKKKRFPVLAFRPRKLNVYDIAIKVDATLPGLGAVEHRSGARADEGGVLFDVAPVSLWIIDQSRLKRVFDTWRAAGVTDLRAWLAAEPGRAMACFGTSRVVRVNQRTMNLLGVEDIAHLTQKLGLVFGGMDSANYLRMLDELWAGRTDVSAKSSYVSLSGRLVDVRLEGQVLPGHEGDWKRVLYAVNDITAEETAQRDLHLSEAYARGLFEESPVSLWVEDFSAVKRLFDGYRARGGEDLPRYMKSHPDFAESCLRGIRVIDVNQQTVRLFGAPDKATLLRRVDEVFRKEVQHYFVDELLQFWDGRLKQHHEVVNYTLGGEPLNMMLQLSVMPGCEQDWSRVLVALTDITARKRAEAEVAFLGRHDVLTMAYNRSFYVEEIRRLESAGPFPVSVVIADLNGLKPVNDRLGHAAGDEMLRRAGEVLMQVVGAQGSVARIGGDEFVILLPGTRPEGAEAMVRAIGAAVEADNRRHGGTAQLSFSMGYAGCEAGGRMEAAFQQADALMYQAKRDYYAGAPGRSRRGRPRAPVLRLRGTAAAETVVG